MFDYANVMEATQPEYEAVLRAHATQFREWASHNRTHREEPVETTFKYWWMFRGPTGFKNSDQALRFRTELLTYILTHSLTDTVLEAPAAALSDGEEPTSDVDDAE